MGNFYINIAVKGVSTPKLQQTLAALPYPSILAPDLDGHTFVYGDFFNSGDTKAASELARTLSALPGAAYAIHCLNADDDLFLYEVWQQGHQLDTHVSSNGAFDPDDADSEPPRGDPSRLKSVFPFIDESAVRTLLDSTDYTFEFERHQDLFRLLRLPTAPAIMDFQYLQNGELPEGLDASRLIHIRPS